MTINKLHITLVHIYPNKLVTNIPIPDDTI